MTTFQLVLSLARRFARNRSIAVSTLAMLACGTIIMGLFITIKAFSLSGGQVVERDLGHYSASVDLAPVTTVDPGDAADAAQSHHIIAAARRAGANQVMLQLQSFDLRPSMAHRPKVIQYTEAAWNAGPFPKRYKLTTGRWPRRPGEVVLTDAAQAKFPATRPLPVLGGAEKFHVVGVATDRYASFPEILAASGTWQTLPDASARGFDEPAAIATLLWSGGNNRQVLSAVANAGGAPRAAARLAERLSTRHSTAAHADKSWLDRLPAGYTIPSVLLPILAVLAIVGLNYRRFHRAMSTMIAVGVPARIAAAGIMSATAAWVVVAALIGCLAGLGLGAAARPICQHFLAQPISPLPNLFDPLLHVLGAACVACLLSGVLLARSASTRGRVSASAAGGNHRGPRARHVRLGAAVIAGLATLAQIPGLDDASKAMTLAGTLAVACLLITPELVAAALRALSRGEPRLRLARQQLLGDRGRAAVGVAVLAAALGLPLGFVTLLDTMITTGNAGVVAMVAPHQVALAGAGGTLQPPSRVIEHAVAVDHLLPGRPITVHYLANDQGPVMIAGTSNGTVYALANPKQVARLTTHHLTQHQILTLRRGGVLTWDSQKGASRHLVTHTSSGHLVRTGGIPSAHAKCDPAWRQGSKGVMLARTAESLNLPIRTGSTVYTGVSDSQAAAAQSTITDRGLNSDEVLRYTSPEPIYVPAVLFAAAAGLAVLVLLTALAVARTQVATLRDYLGRLIAIGLPSRWARHVLMIEATITLGLAIMIGVLIALPPVLFAAWRVPHFVLSIPWGWLGLITAAVCLASMAATGISSRRLRAHDRNTQA